MCAGGGGVIVGLTGHAVDKVHKGAGLDLEVSDMENTPFECLLGIW